MRVVCFKTDCKHKCEASDECIREIMVIDKDGKCKHFHPKGERKADDIY
jgi:peroxiredoxin